MIVDEVRVTRRERLSPSFVRVELGGAALAEFGVDGPSWDQRIKLVFPGSRGLPTLTGADWYAEWLALPDDERGSMRTYTVRDLYGAGEHARLVVDVVVHPGETGPGATWADRATPGDAVLLVGPRRGEEFGGIAFEPGDASELLLVGDETAVPAIAAILGQLPAEARGTAFLEVPWVEDLQRVVSPSSVEVCWLARCGEEPGSRLVPALSRHLGLADVQGSADPDEELIWETPAEARGRSYAWVAGESGVVRTLRRMLVVDAGWDREQVAFMGYWRQGVAMRS